MLVRTVAIGILVVGSSISSTGQATARIETPFEVVSLWTEEMLLHLTGQRQQPCSGPDARKCERLVSGTCDGLAYFGLPRNYEFKPPESPSSVQTESSNPQAFRLIVGQTDGSDGLMTYLHAIGDEDFRAIDLIFDCIYGPNGACPTSRFHVGSVQRVEVGLADDTRKVILTETAKVLPEGKITIPMDARLTQSLFTDRRAMYKVRAVVDCFTVPPSPIEWKRLVRDGPSADARALGMLIVRVIPLGSIELVYRPNSGPDVPFEADWTQPDTGYTYLLEQTVLNRIGDWFLLPPRPFPTAVWIQLPAASSAFPLSAGTVYELSKPVKARESATGRSVTVESGHIVIAGSRGRTLVIRREESFDSPCEDDDAAAAALKVQKVQTYVVDAEEFYDEYLHFRLRPAYPKGC